MNSTPTTVQIALVEDHAELRESWAQVINRAPGFRCTGTFAADPPRQWRSPPAERLSRAADAGVGLCSCQGWRKTA